MRRRGRAGRNVHAADKRPRQDGKGIEGVSGDIRNEPLRVEVPGHQRPRAEALKIDPAKTVAYITQTTLSVDETKGIIEKLKL